MTTSRNVIRKHLVPKMLGISNATLCNWLNPNSEYFRSDLPPLVSLGSNSKGFVHQELLDFLEGLKQAPAKATSTSRKVVQK